MPTAPTVFISYSHKDKVWKDRLLDHLGGLEEEGLLKVWNDRDIGAGDEWFEEIRNAMDAAQVAVFLVSAHSLKSKFIRHKEIPHLLERRAKQGMTFFPVIATACPWDVLPWLAKFQARPLDGRPLESFRGKLNSELTKIAKEILGIVRNGVTGPLPPTQPDLPKAVALLPLHQLPTPPADFTGREEDLDFLRSRQAEGGTGAIFGLRGMGGIGKTILAVKLANELKPRFPDAQIYLDLKGVDSQPLTAAQAMAHVIRAFHPEARLPESEAELAGMYRSVLDGKNALLLMDNAARREQVEPLIPPSTCLLLVTSRFRFALPGLVDRDLGEMPEKDAKALLLRIAPRIQDAADEIARLCGRLPLALRLAGSAIAERPDLSPPQYARLLKERKEKLEPVEATLKTSYDLLTERQERLWRLLTVFPETFDAKAAATVWELDMDNAGSHLGELLRRSLVEWHETEERYRLHDLARLFAYDRAETVERYEAERRHAQHYLSLLCVTNNLFQEDDNIWPALTTFDNEFPNIKAGFFWASSNYEADEIAAQACDSYPIVGADLLIARQSSLEQIQWNEIALKAARQLKNEHSEGQHLLRLGNAYANIDEAVKSIEFYECSLKIFRNLEDRAGESRTLSNQGMSYVQIGEPKRGIETQKRALVIARETEHLREQAQALWSLGYTYSALDEHKYAIELQEQSLIIARQSGFRRGESIALHCLGFSHYRLGEYIKATEFFKQALSVSRNIGDRQGECFALTSLAEVHVKLNDNVSAIRVYEEFIEVSREGRDGRAEAVALNRLGAIYRQNGNFPRSLDCHNQALTLWRNIGSRPGEGFSLASLGYTHEALGQSRSAVGLYNQALTIWHELDNQLEEGRTLACLGNAHADLGDSSRAIELYDQSLKIARGSNDLYTVARALWQCGLLYKKIGNLAHAIDLMQASVDQYLKLGHTDVERYAAYIRTAQFDFEEQRFLVNRMKACVPSES